MPRANHVTFSRHAVLVTTVDRVLSPPLAVPDPRDVDGGAVDDPPGVPALMGRIGELDDQLQKGTTRAADAQGELAALESRVIDESDLMEALASFIPVWEKLFPKEKARILRLLVERVEYHAKDGAVEIMFRPGGVRAMGREAR